LRLSPKMETGSSIEPFRLVATRLNPLLQFLGCLGLSRFHGVLPALALGI